MMTLQEFQASMVTLLNRWPRGYSGDQLSLVYDEVKTLIKPDFDRLVRHLLGSSRVAPMVPDFRKAVQDLGIRTRPVLAEVTPAMAVPQVEDFTYHIRDNIWANNEYIFLRGATVRQCSFIIKSEHPDHPLVIEDKAVREGKIKEIKQHLAKNTYSKFMDTIHGTGLRKMSFDDFTPDPA